MRETGTYETVEVFGLAPVQLRGVLHWPREPLRMGLVMCYPFGEERKSSARVMTQAARAFCRYGLHVMRFDYRGTGESDGTLQGLRLRHWVEDLETAVAHFASRTRLKNVGLLGVRFGAALAAMLPAREIPFRFFAAWAPIWSGQRCLEDCFRRLAATGLVGGADRKAGKPTLQLEDGRIDCGGLLITPQMAADLKATDLPEGASARAREVVIISASAQPDRGSSVDGRVGHAVAGERVVVGRCAAPIRPFWVTASRFNPQALVEQTCASLNCLIARVSL